MQFLTPMDKDVWSALKKIFKFSKKKLFMLVQTAFMLKPLYSCFLGTWKAQQTDDRTLDTATFRLNWPRGRLSEKL